MYTMYAMYIVHSMMVCISDNCIYIHTLYIVQCILCKIYAMYNVCIYTVIIQTLHFYDVMIFDLDTSIFIYYAIK